MNTLEVLGEMADVIQDIYMSPLNTQLATALKDVGLRSSEVDLAGSSAQASRNVIDHVHQQGKVGALLRHAAALAGGSRRQLLLLYCEYLFLEGTLRIDRNVIALSEVEIDQMTAALTAEQPLLGDAGFVREMLRCIGKNSADYAYGSGNIRTDIVQLAAAANLEGWSGDLVLLVEELFPGCSCLGDAQITALRLRASRPTGRRKATEAGAALVNRQALRDKLENMLSASVDRVLQVRGKSKTGRSHTNFYLRSLVGSGGFSKVIEIDTMRLRPDYPEVGAYHMAQILKERLALQFDFSINAEQWRTFKLAPFIESLKTAFAKSPGVVLFFDSFAQTEPADCAYRLVNDLAEAADEEQQFFLILSDFDRDLPIHISSVALED